MLLDLASQYRIRLAPHLRQPLIGATRLVWLGIAVDEDDAVGASRLDRAIAELLTIEVSIGAAEHK